MITQQPAACCLAHLGINDICKVAGGQERHSNKLEQVWQFNTASKTGSSESTCKQTAHTSDITESVALTKGVHGIEDGFGMGVGHNVFGSHAALIISQGS
ncbi:hypothetical protein EYF80_016475 [Liparis tanakae]|uniref:Uncharacterized protein n=1 Tax=Liparis tanakae TaxID=230148 RepID=A0A4Z2I7R4_9TELE|nr:hypothetical protein EYF80_016475 [Liparis tanakae]